MSHLCGHRSDMKKRFVLDLFTVVILQGSAQPGAFGVDDVYISLQAPPAVIPGGGSTFQGATVGAASWGPKNVPTTCNTPNDLLNNFGPPIGSGFDIVQEGSLFLKQLPLGGLIAVRVAHAGDAAATGTLVDTVPATGLTINGLYTGTFGNQILVSLVPGSKDSASQHYWKVVMQAGQLNPEVFDNIIQSATPATTWANILAAINSGQSVTRGPSQLITATIASSTAQPATAGQTITLSGGLNGS